MFDGSHYPIEENVEKTKELIKICREKGMSLEAEVVYINLCNAKGDCFLNHILRNAGAAVQHQRDTAGFLLDLGQHIEIQLLAPGAEAIKGTVREKMELFGSVGKA